jgi:hypothetical protein
MFCQISWSHHPKKLHLDMFTSWHWLKHEGLSENCAAPNSHLNLGSPRCKLFILGESAGALLALRHGIGRRGCLGRSAVSRHVWSTPLYFEGQWVIGFVHIQIFRLEDQPYPDQVDRSCWGHIPANLEIEHNWTEKITETWRCWDFPLRAAESLPSSPTSGYILCGPVVWLGGNPWRDSID